MKKFAINFNPTEDEITFESFANFPLLSFWLAFVNFQQLSKTASFQTKVIHYIKFFMHWFVVISDLIMIVQIFAYGAVHYDNFDVVLRTFLISQLLLSL